MTPLSGITPLSSSLKLWASLDGAFTIYNVLATIKNMVEVKSIIVKLDGVLGNLNKGNEMMEAVMGFVS